MGKFIENRVQSNPDTTILDPDFRERYILEELATIVYPTNLYSADPQTSIKRISQIASKSKEMHQKRRDVHRLIENHTTKHDRNLTVSRITSQSDSIIL